MIEKKKIVLIKYGTENYMVSKETAKKVIDIKSLESEFPDTVFLLVPFYFDMESYFLKMEDY